MSSHADFLAVLRRNRRSMDAERREFAQRAVEILERVTQGEQVFTYVAHARAMVELEPLLSEFYGSFPGDERARYWRLIIDECWAARGSVFQQAVQDVRRRLKREPTLLRVIREEAA